VTATTSADANHRQVHAYGLKSKKSSGRTSPPYTSLNPLDLRVEKLSEDVALVAFHLVDDNTVNRRTLVFKREPNGWKIVHIHASNITTP
jgi:hypothetical protein